MSRYSLIKLSATASTNTYLKELSRTTRLKDVTVVVATHQSKGRGQQGATWFSEEGKSLAFSVYCVFDGVKIENAYYISMAVALGIAEILISLNIPAVKIKWPNDIMSRNKKCGGILIENVLQRDVIKASIIGVGLNVNNVAFPQLPHASSMKLSSGQSFNISEVLDRVVCSILDKLEMVAEEQFEVLHKQYHSLLFKRKKLQVFEDKQLNRFNGIIQGVTENGLLQLLLESDEIKTFALKEVKFCL